MKKIALFLSMLMIAFCILDVKVYASNDFVDLIKDENDGDTYLWATIWPIKDVQFFDKNGQTIDTIVAGTPLTIVNYTEQYFKTYYNNQYGYIKKEFCMVNLPDVLQDETIYDITNAYSSEYRIHTFEIPAITNEILYPNAQLENGEFLVPLLYPVVENLYDAEETALNRGYTLKIYDSYRPNSVSKYIYSTTNTFLNNNPEYKDMMIQPQNGVSYGLSWFLASGVSNHNYGVALDLTIVDMNNGQEMAMQSNMHELSTLSVKDLNNDNAIILQEIMLKNGFNGLKSEWWHYEIPSVRNSYGSFQVSKNIDNAIAKGCL